MGKMAALSGLVAFSPLIEKEISLYLIINRAATQEAGLLTGSHFSSSVSLRDTLASEEENQKRQPRNYWACSSNYN